EEEEEYEEEEEEYEEEEEEYEEEEEEERKKIKENKIEIKPVEQEKKVEKVVICSLCQRKNPGKNRICSYCFNYIEEKQVELIVEENISGEKSEKPEEIIKECIGEISKDLSSEPVEYKEEILESVETKKIIEVKKEEIKEKKEEEKVVICPLCQRKNPVKNKMCKYCFNYLSN
ncbi:MAG: hypothetical protein ABRQ39_15105, partial [Candidatus Eremiobacterota bacterium]